jgi:subtilisin family serine protease
MRRLVLAFCAVVLALSGAGPAAARPAADPGPMVSALVVLSAQAHLRPSRHSAVVERSLRATAANTQRGVLAFLRARQRLVASVTPLWIVNAVSVTAAPSVIRELAARPDVREVVPERAFTAPAPPLRTTSFRALADGPAPPEPNVAHVNAPALWDLGYRGQGVVVANLDTGVDATHPDLSGRWRGGGNSWYDPYGEHPTVPTDVNGHGTATMGVMVGGDSGGTAIGVAPGATWIAAKVFNDRGSATSTAIHLAFQWLLDPDGNPATADAPDVVNDSWTLSGGGCVADFRPDLANLRAAGILPVFAAGNYGPTAGTVLSPANNPEAFAVGATDNADALDPSSSRGPSSCGVAPSPSLVAPGVAVHTTDLYGYYTDASGTSLAAPHVAGTLALLLSAVPDATAERQAAALAGGAVDLGAAGPDSDYGYGRLDALAAYRYLTTVPDFTVAVSPGSARVVPGGSASYQVAVSAANGFTGDVSLSLSGAPGSFDPPVIAGGTGTAQLTVSSATTLGSYPLTITGTSGSRTHNAYATLVVSAPPDFGLTASPASRTVNAGGVAGYAVGVTAKNGFTGTVSFSVSGLPASVGSAAFNPATVTAAGTAQLTVTTVPGAPGGSYPLTVTATSGSLVRSVGVTLVVVARDFALSASPSSVSVPRNQNASYTVSVSALGGFTGAVSLAVSGVPSGGSASLAPNPVGVPGSSTLTVRSGTRGTFTLTVTGTSGALTHQVTVTLTVR